jgi:HD-like signal output (HDOD) protein
MANSPLFGHWKKIDSLRGAVVALGFQRLREIVVSCSILKLVPVGQTQINPVVFWEHSLGCALVCRRFARKIHLSHPERLTSVACSTISASLSTSRFSPRSSLPP